MSIIDTKRIIDRSDLRDAKRENLERLARFLGLYFDPDWSHKHLAGLVYWRITRTDANRH